MSDQTSLKELAVLVLLRDGATEGPEGLSQLSLCHRAPSVVLPGITPVLPDITPLTVQAKAACPSSPHHMPMFSFLLSSHHLSGHTFISYLFMRPV